MTAERQIFVLSPSGHPVTGSVYSFMSAVTAEVKIIGATVDYKPLEF